MLNKARLSIDDVAARTLEYKLDSFERLDRMLASAEARRNNALHEIDRHRSALGAAVRQAVEKSKMSNSETLKLAYPGSGAQS